MKNRLLEKIKNHTAKIGIIGLGYVGLPLAVAFAKKKFMVQGYDFDVEKVNVLNEGKSDIIDIPSEQIKELISTDRLNVSVDESCLSGVDIVIICVPTPLNSHYEPDVSYISHAVETINNVWSNEMLIILESTTYPGCSRELIYNCLIKEGKTDQELLVAYSPERVDPGNRKYSVENTPKVVGGINQAALKVATELYATIIDDVVPVSSIEVAEMSKLLENTFRTINIAFINEMLLLCEHINVDIWEVIEAANTKPFGFMKFSPGPGVGGHCIPLDPMYLSWKAKEKNFFSKFIETANEINFKMLDYLVLKIMEYLNREGKAVKGARILLLGMSYKENIDDLRESPSLKLYEQLKRLGAHIDFCDPLVKRFYDQNGQIKETEPLDYELFASYDLIVVMAFHDCFDKQKLQESAKLILDTKNVFKLDESDTIIRMGSSV